MCSLKKKRKKKFTNYARAERDLAKAFILKDPDNYYITSGYVGHHFVKKAKHIKPNIYRTPYGVWNVGFYIFEKVVD